MPKNPNLPSKVQKKIKKTKTFENRILDALVHILGFLLKFWVRRWVNRPEVLVTPLNSWFLPDRCFSLIPATHSKPA